MFSKIKKIWSWWISCDRRRSICETITKWRSFREIIEKFDKWNPRSTSSDSTKFICQIFVSIKSNSQFHFVFVFFLFFQCEFHLVLAARNQLDEEQIRNWLNYKFPQGFSQLEQSLENVDEDQTGFVRWFNDTFQYKTKTIFFKKKRFAKKIFSTNWNRLELFLKNIFSNSFSND